MPARFSSLSDLVAKNIRVVLAGYGIDAADGCDTNAPERARWIMASIGFSGEHARGAVTVVASRAIWRSYALAAASSLLEADALLADAAGELVNMVLGHVRNDLCRLGVTVHQATPTCAFGEEIAFRDPGAARTRWLRFGLANGPMFVRLDADLAEGFSMRENTELGVEPFEASLMMF